MNRMEHKELCTNEDVYEWLAENTYKYGFIIRYPRDKEEITNTAYEPWHYRYVGLEHAKEMFEEKLCLEEYVYCRIQGFVLWKQRT